MLSQHTIFIDFETRSEADLKVVGPWAYANHPSTEVLVLGYADEDMDVASMSPIIKQDSLFSKAPEWECPVGADDIVVAHNAGFERAIWDRVLVKRFGWPEIPIERWICTAAMAAYNGLPRSLEASAKAAGLDVEKDMVGSRLMLKMCKPRPIWIWTGEGPKWHESPTDLERLASYCRQDVEVTRKLYSRLRPLSASERKVWIFDQRLNERGVAIDSELVSTAIDLADDHMAQASDRIYTLTDGAVKSPTEVSRILEWLANEGVELKDLTADTLAKELNVTDGILYEVLKLRQEASKASVKKFRAMEARGEDNGRLRDMFVYHGAGPGRWSGSGPQGQNLKRPEFDRNTIENIGIPLIKRRDAESINLLFGDVPTLLSSCLRSAFCAAPGHDLICADYSSIEACVLLWLAGDTDAVAKINQGKDLYVDMAARIYGKPIDEVTETERQLGKVAILGLGYGMGVKKFYNTCLAWGIQIDMALAERTVDLYRKTYASIVYMWRKIEQCAILALRNISESFNGIQFHVNQNAIMARLPSGRDISYAYPEVGENQFGKPCLTYTSTNAVTKKWERTDTYGGKLVENIVQGTARDILVDGMLAVEAAGYPVVLTVHDEAVAEVPKEFGSLDEYIRLLCTSSPWARGCPIRAKGWRGERYGK